MGFHGVFGSGPESNMGCPVGKDAIGIGGDVGFVSLRGLNVLFIGAN